jgi:hypothetical protein
MFDAVLTRLYKKLPEVRGRLYTQPSRKIGISQFDIINPDSTALPTNWALGTAKHSRHLSGDRRASW